MLESMLEPSLMKICHRVQKEPIWFSATQHISNAGRCRFLAVAQVNTSAAEVAQPQHPKRVGQWSQSGIFGQVEKTIFTRTMMMRPSFHEPVQLRPTAKV
jgi:hypothetical protein